MSNLSTLDPQCENSGCPHAIDVEVIPRSVDLGGFTVGRVLPSQAKRTVGPFVFWDQAGPGEFLTGRGIDVRPHPHICLSTMTYLFQGSLEHRDTLGTHQIITPGAVNLMTAGRGIAHSERSPQAVRRAAHQLFGIQCWLALPKEKEEMQPCFGHYDATQIPVGEDAGVDYRIVSGHYLGVSSPVNTQIPALFVECYLKEGAAVTVPATEEERAIHILSGKIVIDKVEYAAGRMLVLKPGCVITVTALTAAHLILLGGPALDAPRFVWWNFVASSKERIEQGKLDWVDGRFGKIPGDDREFIPLPGE